MSDIIDLFTKQKKTPIPPGKSPAYPVRPIMRLGDLELLKKEGIIIEQDGNHYFDFAVFLSSYVTVELRPLWQAIKFLSFFLFSFGIALLFIGLSIFP